MRHCTPVHYRFQVCCSYCGMLEQFTTKARAFEYAQRARGKHANCEKIEVYDAMAHKGEQNLQVQLHTYQIRQNIL